MDLNDYQKQAERTEADPEQPRLRITGLHQSETRSVFTNTRLIHAVFGMMTEVGELVDVLKKHFFYGRQPDFDNMDEEVGDLMWYVALYCNARGVRLPDILAANNRKLRARYPEKFTEYDALNRDISKEVAALTNPCREIDPPKLTPCQEPGCTDERSSGGTPFCEKHRLERLREAGDRRDWDECDRLDPDHAPHGCVSDLDVAPYGGGAVLDGPCPACDNDHARLSDDGNPIDPPCPKCGGKMSGPACPHCDCEYA